MPTIEQGDYRSPQAVGPDRVVHSNPAQSTSLVTLNLTDYRGQMVEVSCNVEFAWLCTVDQSPSTPPSAAANSGAGRMVHVPPGVVPFVVDPDHPFLHIALSATGKLSVVRR